MNRELKSFLVTEKLDGKVMTHKILAPSASSALGFQLKNMRGVFSSIQSIPNDEMYIIDYRDYDNEDSIDTELKYTVSNN